MQVLRQLLNAEVDVKATAAAIVTFVVVHSVAKFFVRPTPWGPKLHRVKRLADDQSTWLQRLLLGDVATFFWMQPGEPHLKMIRQAREACGDGANALFYFGRAPRIMLGNLEDVRHVLIDAPNKFRKEQMNLILVPLLGRHGLVTIIDEDYHTKQRKAVSHAFGTTMVRGIAATTMREHFTEMIRTLRAATSDEPRPLDVVFDGTALKIISQAAFNTDDFVLLSKETRNFGAIAKFNRLFVLGPAFLNWLPLRRNRESTRLRRLVADILKPTLQRAKDDSSNAPHDTDRRRPKMLVELLADNPDLTPNEILDHAVTFLFAGHETTATALMWFCYYVAKNPATQNTLADELSDAFHVDTTPSVESLVALPYLDAAVREVLRVRPPVVVIVRAATEDTILPGSKTNVPAGTALAVPIHGLHRDPLTYGADADEFRPERWLDDPELKERVQPSAWMPFGAGKRACIGREFAMLELALGAALMVRNFNIALPEGDPEPYGVHGVVVKPRDPIRFVLTRRFA